MKTFALNLLMVGCFIYSGLVFSQTKKSIHRISQPSPKGIYRCLSDEYNAELLKKHPNMMGSSAFEKKLQKIIKERKTSRLQRANGPILVRIPVVVHVIHNGTAIGVGANISDAQVLSQIQVLNEDFRKMAGTRGENSHMDGADTNIEFYLAQEDPNGCFTKGIERYDLSSISTTWSGPGGNTDTILKPLTIWDSSRYLNMWTVTFINSTDLGYGQFPSGPADTDGVVMGYEYFGSNDAIGVNLDGSIPYDLGRTTTHEIGHFLSLWHTFQGGCNGVGDEVADTPPTAQENYDCPVGQDSCPPAPDGILDMVENYMDYTDDACMNIFTNGQSARMDGVLSGDRLALANSTVSETPKPSVNYDASINVIYILEDPCTGTYTPLVSLTNRGTMTLTAATLSYNLNGGTPVIINWTGSLVEGASENIDISNLVTLPGTNTFNISVSQPNANTDQRSCNNSDSGNFVGTSYESMTAVHLKLVTDDYPEETSWEFRDSSNMLLDSDSYNPSQNNQTFNYVIGVVPNECYTFTIFDNPATAAPDGICCAYGEGSYELRTNDNTLIASGGQFGDEESTMISTTTLSVSNYFIANDISLYPNPTSNDLSIKVRAINNLPNSIQVYNMLGQIMMTKSIMIKEDLIIKTSNFGKGMYFIRIVKDNANITLPFIKK